MDTMNLFVVVWISLEDELIDLPTQYKKDPYFNKIVQLINDKDERADSLTKSKIV